MNGQPASTLPTLKGLVKRASEVFLAQYGHQPTAAEEVKEVARVACEAYDQTVRQLRAEGYMLDSDAVAADGLTQDIKKIPENEE